MAASKCCCCIPLRGAVLAIALLSALASIGWLVALVIEKDGILASGVNLSGIYWAMVAVTAFNIAASLFGIAGSLGQSRRLVVVFKVVYWFMTIAVLCLTLAGWIYFVIKRDAMATECSNILSGESEIKIPTFLSKHVDSATDCPSTVTRIIILSGVGIVLGNIIALYFATVITSYTSRLKRGLQHHPLRDLEDFPQASYKTSTY